MLTNRQTHPAMQLVQNCYTVGVKLLYSWCKIAIQLVQNCYAVGVKFPHVDIDFILLLTLIFKLLTLIFKNDLAYAL